MNKAIILLLLLSACAYHGPIYQGHEPGNVFIYRPIGDGNGYLTIRANHHRLCALHEGAFVVTNIDKKTTITITKWGPTGYSHANVNPGDYIRLQDRSNFFVMDAAAIKISPEQARQELIGLTQDCK